MSPQDQNELVLLCLWGLEEQRNRYIATEQRQIDLHEESSGQ